MRTIDLFPVTTEMGYPARTMMQRRERAAGPVSKLQDTHRVLSGVLELLFPFFPACINMAL